jgi:hypothetical protein
MEKLKTINKLDFKQSHIVYAIYDLKMDSYTPPFIQPNDGTAIRFIMDIMTNEPNSSYSRHSNDYDLRRIAKWDTRSGLIQPDHPQSLQKLSVIKQSMTKEL